METKKGLSGLEKFAYGIGAVGKDMVYMLSASYVLYYFQDIMGVSAIAMGIILLIARVFDAFNDPIMGIVVAKTKTKWGKFRPWLLIGTVTNAVILIMMFAAPPTLDAKGLIAYAAITYILWGVTYTMMDIPYWSMIPAFTEGGKEREGLSALARSCAGVGSALVTILTVMCVAALGNSFAGKNADNKTVTITSQDKTMSSYVVLLDEDGNATSTMKSYDSEHTDIEVTITGTDKMFDGVEVQEADTFVSNVLTVSSDNAKVSARVGSDIFGEIKAKYADHGTASPNAVVVFYVEQDAYGRITAADTLTGKVNMESTLEVERVGFKYFTIIIGILFVVFTAITCIFIKEKSSVDMKTASVGQMFKALVQNDQAMTIVLTIVLINTATYITSNLLIYFFKYDLAGSNWQGNYTLFNTFAGGIQIFAMMLFFPLLRKAFSTLKIFYIGVFSAIGGYLILLVMALMGTKSVFPFFVPGFFIMGAVGILNVIVTIFLANTVDYGELKNRRRDESVIFSMQTFVVKLASGIAALVASICLAVFDIQADSTGAQTASMLIKSLQDAASGADTAIDGSAVVGLRLVMTLAPIVVLVVALLIFKARYILTDKKLEEIAAELKSREN
ncbi:MFS/sugar transport protein [Ruminococcaceae bacterium KH2T8]|nr:MFS/sugar transport protein [Ruminococcaceae bacterium KH2T8]